MWPPLGPVVTELIEVARRVQTWEASGSVTHGVATPVVLLGDRPMVQHPVWLVGYTYDVLT
jgi:hypothetical protein